MTFKTLFESHPEVTRDRHSLSFSRTARPLDIAGAFSRQGVVMLKDALPLPPLVAAGRAFSRCLQSSHAARGNDAGSWHSPWQVPDRDDFPAAAILAAVMRSWAWEVVEAARQSSHLAAVRTV